MVETVVVYGVLSSAAVWAVGVAVMLIGSHGRVGQAGVYAVVDSLASARSETGTNIALSEWNPEMR